MNPREAGFLLLTGKLGREGRRPLTTAQLRSLGERVAYGLRDSADRELQLRDLLDLGYREEMAQRILSLLAEEDLLREYIRNGEKSGCVPITRVSRGYPLRLRRQLGEDSPGCLWAKGNLDLLQRDAVALVGSREVQPENGAFAAEVGRQAAAQGLVLVSGNARGADRIAQQSCLDAGGCVISVVSDQLYRQQPGERMLFLSEDSYDEAFSTQRALSRNRVIHALGLGTFVAQSGFGQGGTWNGTVKNLRHTWSPVFCYEDGSDASKMLHNMGAELINLEALPDIQALCRREPQTLF